MRRSLVAFISPVLALGFVACDAVTEPPPGDPVNITFAPCVGASTNPTWLAVQDGDGSWTRVTPTASGAYAFTISSGRAGVATHSADGLSILYATTEELQDNLGSCGGLQVRTVSGSVTGYTALDNVFLQMGESFDLIGGNLGSPQSFTLSEVDPNATDLVAVRYREIAGPTSYEVVPSRVFIRRGVTAASTGQLDMNSTTESGQPSQRSVNVTNLAQNEALALYAWLATGSTMSNISRYEGNPVQFPGSVTAPFYGLPASRLSFGENQMLEILADKTTSNTSDSRIGTVLYADVTDQTFTLGPAIGPISVVGSARPAVSYTIQSEYSSVFAVAFEQNTASISIVMTKGYNGVLGTVTLAVPNLTGVSGFQSAWLITPGTSATWAFKASSGGLASLYGAPVAYLAARRASVFTP